MKIMRWLGTALLVGVLLPLTPLMAGDHQAVSEFWDLAWSLKYTAGEAPSDRFKSIDSRSESLVEFVSKNDDIDTTAFLFRDSVKYVLESGDEAALNVVLNLGFSDKLYKRLLSDTAVNLNLAYKHKYSDDLDYKLWRRYDRSMTMLLRKASERGFTSLPDDFLKVVYPEASLQLIKLVAPFQVNQKEVDEAFTFYGEQYFNANPKEALEKLQVLIDGYTPPSPTVIQSSFNKALDEKKTASEVAVFFNGVGQEEMDAALDKFYPYLLQSQELQAIFDSKHLQLRVDDNAAETPFSKTVATHLHSPVNELLSGLNFVMAHYDVSGGEADSLATRRLISTGDVQLYSAVRNTPDVESQFAKVFEDNVGQLLKVSSNDDATATHRKVISAIASTSYELDYESHIEPLVIAGHASTAEVLLDKLSDEQLSEHQLTLVLMVGRESVRELIASRGFRFTAKEGSFDTPLKKALELHKKYKSDKTRMSFNFVLQHSDLSSPDDIELLTAAMNDMPFLFRRVMQGAPGLEALQQEAATTFTQALTELRLDDLELLLGNKEAASRKELFAKFPAPSDGFEALICSLGSETGFPADAPVEGGIDLILEWATAQNYQLNLDSITDCTLAERAVLRKMSNAQLGQILKILFKNNWDLTERSNRALFSKVEQRVLDNGLRQLIAAQDKSLPSRPLRLLFVYFDRLVGEGGGVKISSHLLPIAEAVTGYLFKDLSVEELIVPYVDYLLPLYPGDLYLEYLKEIYRSDNVEFLAYVLSNPDHQSRFRRGMDTVLSGRLGDFDAALTEKVALLIHSCIVPEHSDNELVVMAIQQCHGSLIIARVIARGWLWWHVG